MYLSLSKLIFKRRKMIDDLESKVSELESRFQDLKKALAKARLNKEETVTTLA